MNFRFFKDKLPSVFEVKLTWQEIGDIVRWLNSQHIFYEVQLDTDFIQRQWVTEETILRMCGASNIEELRIPDHWTVRIQCKFKILDPNQALLFKLIWQ